jgi:hypothetical protein
MHAGCRGAGILRIMWTTMTAFALRRNYCVRDDWKKGAVTIDNSASAALTWKNKKQEQQRAHGTG